MANSEWWNGGEWRIAIGEWLFLEGSAPALPKNFRRIRRCALQFYQPALAGFVSAATNFSWWTNFGGSGSRQDDSEW